MMVGFLILNYNSWELSRRLAIKVSQYGKINRVVVVDNCSTDESYGKLKDIEEQHIVILKSPQNGGYAYGNNYGAQYCKSIGIDILFISNPDVDIEEMDIDKIIESFETSSYSVLSGVEYDINKNMSQPPIWKPFKYKDDLLDCLFFGRKLCAAKKGIELKKDIKIQQTGIVKGSFLAVRLEDFLNVGGFDENTFLFCEERILGRRMALYGKSIGVVTDAKYYHNHSVSINKSYSRISEQIEILYKSRMYYQKKYNNINLIQEKILDYTMKLSILEYRLIGKVNH